MWRFETDCDAVELTSTFFDLEYGFDTLIIDGVEHTGSTPISQTVESSSFVINFNSDHSQSRGGFSLLWTCDSSGKFGWAQTQ